MHMSTNVALYEPPAALRLATQAYTSFLLLAFALPLFPLLLPPS